MIYEKLPSVICIFSPAMPMPNVSIQRARTHVTVNMASGNITTSAAISTNVRRRQDCVNTTV